MRRGAPCSLVPGAVDTLHGVGGGQGRQAAVGGACVSVGPAGGLADVLLSRDGRGRGPGQRGGDGPNLRHTLLHRHTQWSGNLAKARLWTLDPNELLLPCILAVKLGPTACSKIALTIACTAAQSKSLSCLLNTNSLTQQHHPVL